MLGKAKKNKEITLNGSHPVLSDEDIEIITSFCKIFQDGKGYVDIEKMIQNMENTEEFNVGVVKRILVWIEAKNRSKSELSRDPS